MLRSNRRIVTPTIMAVLVAGLIMALPSGSPGHDTLTGTAAHDIPSDVTIQAFVKPEGQRLRLLVRVPLNAMQDIEFPLRGPGYLDIARADAQLTDAAIRWIGNEIELYEGNTRLRNQQIVAVRASIPSDKSFGTFEDALAHVTGPRLPDETSLYWEHALLDVLFAPTSTPAIRAWSGSILGGTRPPCGSSRWGSPTSWTGSTTCCSCFAS